VTFGSLFSGIGGMDLGELRQLVAALAVEGDKATGHQCDGCFLKLKVPVPVGFSVAQGKVLKAVVMFVQVDVVNHLSFAKRPSKMFSHNDDMLSNVAAASGVRMLRDQQVKIAVAESRSLAALPLALCGKNSAASPVGIKRPSLPFTLDGFTGHEPHAIHRSPDDLLCGSITHSNFGLRKPQDLVIVP
jgi:hypothetical protein